MDAPRALIADDERLMREQLRARLAEVWPELQIVAEARNGAEAVELAEREHPDIVFLDIRMPAMTGIEAARAIAMLPTDDDTADGWPGCDIVFITAYDEYAVQAFEQGAVDYVLKPAERERLARTVERVRGRLAARAAARSAGGDDGAAAAPAGLQQLLQKLAQHTGAGAMPRLRWIQASVGAEIRISRPDGTEFQKTYSDSSPSQNTGADTKNSAVPMAMRSHAVPRLSAEMTPTGMPMASHSRAPPMMMVMVTCARWISSGRTACLVWNDLPRPGQPYSSPTTRRLRNSPYCSGTLLSSPSDCLTSWISSGVGDLPAKRVAGSPLGITKKMMKVSMVTSRTTRTVHSSRLMM